MNAGKGWRSAVFAAVISPLALGGCVVAPAGQPYYAGEPVMLAPPPPRVDVVGVAPYPGYIWIGGYWNWHSGRHHWVPGRWEPPRHGHRWVPHRWEPYGSSWRQHPGRWERN